MNFSISTDKEIFFIVLNFYGYFILDYLNLNFAFAILLRLAQNLDDTYLEFYCFPRNFDLKLFKLSYFYVL